MVTVTQGGTLSCVGSEGMLRCEEGGEEGKTWQDGARLSVCLVYCSSTL